MAKSDELLSNLISEINQFLSSRTLIDNHLQGLSQKDREILEKRLNKEGITTDKQLVPDDLPFVDKAGKKPSGYVLIRGKAVEKFTVTDELRDMFKASAEAAVKESNKYR